MILSSTDHFLLTFTVLLLLQKYIQMFFLVCKTEACVLLLNVYHFLEGGFCNTWYAACWFVTADFQEMGLR